MTEYHAAAWVIPMESGLKKKHIDKVLRMLPEDSELVPFEILGEGSCAYGFATVAVIEEENGLGAVIDLLEPLVEDWTEDASDCTVTLPGGKKAFIGCDYRTVLVGRIEPEDHHR
ncbi:hypothetical protein LPY66_04665 [Dehalobacter sp. DCM]|uniref:hypothetical protein n=1 Tax=Dehalobacter sp. DCM TaxID=2907827 RepID=UPI003081C6C3|nr:hypothetical protein LPY66_04665 [Dehalobacter sp. DCM]